MGGLDCVASPLTRRSNSEALFGGDLSPQERGEVLFAAFSKRRSRP